jgi:hypothetical protein
LDTQEEAVAQTTHHQEELILLRMEVVVQVERVVTKLELLEQQTLVAAVVDQTLMELLATVRQVVQEL